jgi:hypothetical protein
MTVRVNLRDSRSVPFRLQQRSRLRLRLPNSTAEHARLAQGKWTAEDNLFESNPWYEWVVCLRTRVGDRTRGLQRRPPGASWRRATRGKGGARPGVPRSVRTDRLKALIRVRALPEFLDGLLRMSRNDAVQPSQNTCCLDTPIDDQHLTRRPHPWPAISNSARQ